MHPLIFYLIASIVTFVIYGFDKLAAEKKWRRVPERSLHIFALGGGFAGALLGRKYFRHKTLKPEFLIIPVIAGVLHGAFWVLKDIQLN